MAARTVLGRVLKSFQASLARLAGLPLGWFGFRFVVFPYRSIGHLASEPDLWVKERLLGRRAPARDILLPSRETVANRHLLGYWRRHYLIVEHPFWSRALESLAAHSGLKVDPVEYYRSRDRDRGVYRTVVSHEVMRAWGDRPPVLSLSEPDRLHGREVLRRLGVPDDAWFVCVQNREPGYYHRFANEWDRDENGPRYDESFRDCRIENYQPAMDAIIERGGWCIRMGDPATRPLAPSRNVVDYAHLDIKSERMDVFLCASCRFFLGNTSGLFFLSAIFGVPSALANMAPLSSLWGYRGDLGIPKLLWSRAEGRWLTFKEIYDSPVSDYFSSAAFDAAGVDVIENTAEDIRDLALEMLERTEGRTDVGPEDERLQTRMRSLLRPGHYGYGAVARVGRDFLRKYEALIGDDEPELQALRRSDASLPE